MVYLKLFIFRSIQCGHNNGITMRTDLFNSVTSVKGNVSQQSKVSSLNYSCSFRGRRKYHAILKQTKRAKEQRQFAALMPRRES